MYKIKEKKGGIRVFRFAFILFISFFKEREEKRIIAFAEVFLHNFFSSANTTVPPLAYITPEIFSLLMALLSMPYLHNRSFFPSCLPLSLERAVLEGELDFDRFNPIYHVLMGSWEPAPEKEKECLTHE